MPKVIKMRNVCKNHSNKEAVGFCQTCGEYFCEKCLRVDGDYYYCREHFSKLDFNDVPNSILEMESTFIDTTKKKNNSLKKWLFGFIWFVIFYFSLWLLIGIIFSFSNSGDYSNFEEGYRYGSEVGTEFAESGGRILTLFLSAFISFILSYKGILPGTRNGKKIKIAYNSLRTKNITTNINSYAMLNFIKNTARLKAIYLLWVSFHLILFVISGNFITESGRFFIFENSFYPFDKYSTIRDYDLSELIVYLIVPISIYFFAKLWYKNKNQ